MGQTTIEGKERGWERRGEREGWGDRIENEIAKAERR